MDLTPDQTPGPAMAAYLKDGGDDHTEVSLLTDMLDEWLDATKERRRITWRVTEGVHDPEFGDSPNYWWPTDPDQAFIAGVYDAACRLKNLAGLEQEKYDCARKRHKEECDWCQREKEKK